MNIEIRNKWGWKQKRKAMCTCSMCETIEDMKADKVYSAVMVTVRVAVSILILLLWPRAAQAAVTEEQAVRAIIGEAANQGEHGMICVAEVLRRRGSTKGFYGYKAKHVNKQPAWVWAQARKAWRESAHTNYTRGAWYFENVKAFGQPCWAGSCVEVYRHKDHVFFAERRPRHGKKV
jgi:hypothetical protein